MGFKSRSFSRTPRLKDEERNNSSCNARPKDALVRLGLRGWSELPLEIAIRALVDVSLTPHDRFLAAPRTIDVFCHLEPPSFMMKSDGSFFYRSRIIGRMGAMHRCRIPFPIFIES